MPGGGIAAAWEIRGRLPETRIVFLTVSDDDRDLFAALRTGASGYLLKDMDLRELPALLAAAAAGEGVLPGTLTARVIAEYRSERPRRETVALDGRPAFTSREWDVLELLQMGFQTRQIARRLSLTPATVRSHIAAIVKKVGASDRDEALALLAGP
jgi:DNA-binding NarL/FixJ family response regulator